MIGSMMIKTVDYNPTANKILHKSLVISFCNVLKKPAVLFLLIVFSPYVYHGVIDIRLDHFLLLLLAAIRWKKIIFGIPFHILLWLYICIMVTTLFSDRQFSHVYLFSSMEWYFRGFILWVWCYYENIEEKDIKGLTYALFASAIVIGFGAILQQLPLTSKSVTLFFAHWYSDPSPFNESGASFLEIIIGSGRAVSFLAQPGTYGMFFLLVTINFVILDKKVLNVPVFFRVLLIAMVIICGPLSVSKAFIFGAPMFLFLWTIFNLKRRQTRYSLILVSIVIIGLAISGSPSKNVLSNTDAVTQRFEQLLSPKKIGEETIGKRYGKEGALKKSLELIKLRPLLGYGMVWGIRLCDSLFVPLLVFGGTVAVMIYLLYLYSTIRLIAKSRNRSFVFKEFRIVLFVLIFVYLAFGVGYPTLTQDKIGDYVWILIGSVGSIAKQKRRDRCVPMFSNL